MLALLKQQSNQLWVRIEPQIKILKDRWTQLLPRERLMLIIMGVFLVVALLFYTVTGLISYKQKLLRDVDGLNQFMLYAEQSKTTFKKLSKIDANKITTPTIDQIKSDIKQILQIDNPDVNLQDGQLVVNIPNAKFSDVMTFLDQLRRSYGLFPEQLNIVRQSKSGYVSFNATFWITQ